MAFDADAVPPSPASDCETARPASPRLRKKLIEVSIPLEAINAASAKEKSIRHGHPSTLHLWWARRPLAACRAVLFAQLVDDPSSWPDRFDHDLEKIDAERQRLHGVIEAMVPWEASNDEAILNAARWEIARSVAWGKGEEPPPRDDGAAILRYLQTEAPPVYDPFSGGGSIPLEAQRLGLRAYGSDLNPVAVLIGKALVEIPPKFAGLPPVNPEARAELARGGAWQGRGAQGLAEDVRYYGRWMRDEAERRIGHLYPKAELPDGSEATAIAWLWARTVRSPDPAAKGAMVPLVSSFMLSTKEGKKAWVEVVRDAAAQDGWRFEVRTGALAKDDEERLKLGTKGGKGQAFLCAVTGSAIERSYIQAEGKADRLSQRLMAVVAEGPRSRVYVTPNHEHEVAAGSVDTAAIVTEARESFLSPSTPTRAMITGGVCSAYGLRTYGHLFTSRQIVALRTFSELVSAARENVLLDSSGTFKPRAPDLPTARTAALSGPLHAGGIGAEAYADAVATYLALALGRSTDYWSQIATWVSTGEFIRNTFARQAIPMTWDFAEANPFSSASGGWQSTSLEWVPKALMHTQPVSSGVIVQKVAQDDNFSSTPVIFSTDPPYYDNIAYADLADYFYVWHRQTLSKIWPELYRRLTTPKDRELVATLYRHGSVAAAEAFFAKEMGHALVAMRDSTSEAEPLVIYYAFKQSEIASDGVTSAGWAAFLQSIIDASLTLDGTWPVRTERSARTTSLGANALASSVVLVCRKRPADAPMIGRAAFVRALKREMPDAIAAIRKAGVGPVDMQQSVIGPGMGVFSRHAAVREDDDSLMSVRTALALINRVWAEIEDELDGAFDAPTQVALVWYGEHGFEAKPSGELIALANAKNTADRALFASGVFTDGRGRSGLTPRNRLPAGWSPASDKSLTVWECVQHAARTLAADDGGTLAAARLVAGMGTRAAEARKLTERLFSIATNNGWSAEALVYNELAEEWPRLEELALGIAAAIPAPAAPAQPLLI